MKKTILLSFLLTQATYLAASYQPYAPDSPPQTLPSLVPMAPRPIIPQQRRELQHPSAPKQLQPYTSVHNTPVTAQNVPSAPTQSHPYTGVHNASATTQHIPHMAPQQWHPHTSAHHTQATAQRYVPSAPPYRGHRTTSPSTNFNYPSREFQHAYVKDDRVAKQEGLREYQALQALKYAKERALEAHTQKLAQQKKWIKAREDEVQAAETQMALLRLQHSSTSDSYTSTSEDECDLPYTPTLFDLCGLRTLQEWTQALSPTYSSACSLSISMHDEILALARSADSIRTKQGEQAAVQYEILSAVFLTAKNQTHLSLGPLPTYLETIPAYMVTKKLAFLHENHRESITQDWLRHIDATGLLAIKNPQHTVHDLPEFFQGLPAIKNSWTLPQKLLFAHACELPYSPQCMTLQAIAHSPQRQECTNWDILSVENTLSLAQKDPNVGAHLASMRDEHFNQEGLDLKNTLDHHIALAATGPQQNYPQQASLTRPKPQQVPDGDEEMARRLDQQLNGLVLHPRHQLATYGDEEAAHRLDQQLNGPVLHPRYQPATYGDEEAAHRLDQQLNGPVLHPRYQPATYGDEEAAHRLDQQLNGPVLHPRYQPATYGDEEAAHRLDQQLNGPHLMPQDEMVARALLYNGFIN